VLTEPRDLGENLVRRFSERVAGANVLITGGGSGIGLALGAAMARDGAHVMFADIDPIAARGAAEGICAAGGDASGIRLDVTDREAFADAVKSLVTTRGSIDYLVNCAGISIGGPTHELTGSHWDAVVDVNLGGVVNGVLAAYPHMVRAGHGHLVNVASGAGLVPLPFVVGYSAAKHAVVGLSLGLRPEAARHGVHVSVVCPGAVETPILDRLPPTDLPATPTAPVTPRAFLSVLGQAPIDADRFARAALRHIVKDQPVIVVPARLRALWGLHRISPTLTQHLARFLTDRVERDLLVTAEQSSTESTATHGGRG
jgi:NAD(P)-dependent dehydrogenase (short-subunit alcohol dehydrogenase family)